MPKIDFTPEEMTQIAAALETEIKSAKRAQNTSRTPQLKAVWEQHEATLAALRGKVMSAR